MIQEVIMSVEKNGRIYMPEGMYEQDTNKLNTRLKSHSFTYSSDEDCIYCNLEDGTSIKVYRPDFVRIKYVDTANQVTWDEE